MEMDKTLPSIISWKKYSKTCAWMCKAMVAAQRWELHSYKKHLKEGLRKGKFASVFDVDIRKRRKKGGKHDIGMIGYYLFNIGRLIAGYYCFDSHIYDVEDGEAVVTPERIREIEAEVAAGADYWLVTVDLHN